MTQSLDIIRHILDENLIDAKKATEGYLNDILSGAIKEQYKEVAPSLVEEKGGAKGAMSAANMSAAVAAPAAQTAAMQQGSGDLLRTDADAIAYVRENFTNPDGTLNTSIESILAQAFEAGLIASGAQGGSIALLLSALTQFPTEGPGDGGNISDPISVAGYGFSFDGDDGGDGDPADPPVVFEPPREGDSQFGGSVGGFRGT